jgi:methylenetetrahydrofolate dehydrogenase (NADP+) / methenyltetrahydrofolate cyclohydrolase
MRIDGREIATKIYQSLGDRVEKLQRHNITPHLAVILIGNDPASESYVFMKKKRGEEIGCIVDIITYPDSVTEREVINRIKELNRNDNVHGIIVQRPVPTHIDQAALDEAVIPEKDVDGFNEESDFREPIALAVEEILKDVFVKEQRIGGEGQGTSTPTSDISRNISEYASVDEFINKEYPIWLSTKKVCVLGKGKTGGTPTIKYFKNLNIEPEIVDSKTTSPDEITRNADIIVATVGKKDVLKKDAIKKGSILIAIGMHKGADGKLHADYDEEEVAEVAGFYTPVPGGVGPVNVAMLLENVITSTENNYHSH